MKTYVFDTYGTLFNVQSVAEKWPAGLGKKANQVPNTRRGKQLQYSWLRSLMGEFITFWQMAGEAMDYALSESRVEKPRCVKC